MLYNFNMHDKSLLFIRASFEGDFKTARKIANESNQDDPCYKSYLAMLACLDVFLSQGSVEIALIKLRDALDAPQGHADIYLMLLNSAAKIAIYQNRLGEAQRIFRLMKQLGERQRNPEIKAFLPMTEWRILRALGKNISKQLALLNEVLAIHNQPGNHTWLVWILNRIHCAIENDEFAVAEKDLAEIESFQSLIIPPEFTPLSFVKAYFFCACGKANEGLKIIDNMSQAAMTGNRGYILRLRIWLLQESGRLKKSKKYIDQAKELIQENPAKTISKDFISRRGNKCTRQLPGLHAHCLFAAFNKPMH